LGTTNTAQLKQATSDFLAPLQKLAEEIKNANLFSAIEVAGLKAKELAAQQAKLIREAVAGASGNKPPAGADTAPAQHIRLASIQPLGKALTNADDVNSFIDKVHGKLLEAVKKGPVFLE